MQNSLANLKAISYKSITQMIAWIYWIDILTNDVILLDIS